MNMERPVVLCILDGWGYSAQRVGNAIANASKPYLEDIEKNYPSLLLQASGLGVGMTWGETGNSEVGHLTLGAGRSIYQYLYRINKDIESGYFFQNAELMKAVNHVKSNNSAVHFVGLLSSGSVHAYFNHLLALLELTKANNISNYRLHLFTDGKDSALQEAPDLIKKMDEYFPGSMANISTIIGRDDAMDRNNRWELTQKTFELWTQGKGNSSGDVLSALSKYYENGFNDHNIPPTVINTRGLINDNDAVVFFNFREDSMRQISRVFVSEYFDYFPRELPQNLFVLAFSQYIESTRLKAIYPPPFIANGLAEVLSTNGKTQFHIAETEKYAHVTYFFNCLKNKPLDGETDFFLESVPDAQADPLMRVHDIVSKVTEELSRDYYDFFVINFANADILAHLGNLEVTTKGVEVVDVALGRLKEAVLAKNGILIITADHGNAERVVYGASGNPETKHDQNPVPFYLVASEFQRPRSEEEIAASRREARGILSDVAPSILELMSLPIPSEMTGESLLRIIG